MHAVQDRRAHDQCCTAEEGDLEHGLIAVVAIRIARALRIRATSAKTGLERNKVSEISKLRIRAVLTPSVPIVKSAELRGIHLVLHWILVMRLTRLS